MGVTGDFFQLRQNGLTAFFGLSYALNAFAAKGAAAKIQDSRNNGSTPCEHLKMNSMKKAANDTAAAIKIECSALCFIKNL
jgi:hypothetical protein